MNNITDTGNDAVQALEEWRGRLKAFLLSKALLGIPTVTTLLEDLEDITKGLDVPPVGGLSVVSPHPIDRLGCGLSVLSMHCDGMEAGAIAKVVENQTGTTISANEVQAWVESYERSGVVRRNTMTNLSIFDTKNRMEDIYIGLQKLMNDVDDAEEVEFSRSKTTRYEVQLAAWKEMRAATKDAKQIVEALHQMNTYRELADIILQEIGQESPAVQSRIVKALKAKGAIIKAIMPSS